MDYTCTVLLYKQNLPVFVCHTKMVPYNINLTDNFKELSPLTKALKTINLPNVFVRE